jgi:hypothetical protein
MFPIHSHIRAAVLSIAVLTLGSTSLAYTPQALAQTMQAGYTAGQRLSKEQVQALGALQNVEIDARAYRVLQTRTGANGQPVTALLNQDGVVGLTHHEVLISNQPTAQVRQQADATLATAVEVTYYDHTHITVARYASLEQAITALAKIRTAVPEAMVGLPITFAKPTLY